jgi:hypothetical protein
MTDTANERNLHYLLDVEFKREESRDFLVEKGIKYFATRDIDFSLLEMNLEIFEIHSEYLVDHGTKDNEYLKCKAKFRGSRESISLFGCDRKLQHIDISIFPTRFACQNPPNNYYQFFSSEQSCKEDHDVQENVAIKFGILPYQFDTTKDFLKRGLINKIYCDLKFRAKSLVGGLYISESSSNYKVLCNKKRIINNKLFTNDLYEVSEDRHEEYFSIRLVEKNLFELKS